MKRILTILVTTLVMAILAAPALARELKVPKQICFGYNSNSEYIAVGTKKSTKVKFSYGKETFYTVEGLQNSGLWVPASGTAYTVDGTTIMRMNLTSDWLDFQSFEIYWDLDTDAGYLYVFSGNAGNEKFYNDLIEVVCKDFSF